MSSRTGPSALGPGAWGKLCRAAVGGVTLRTGMSGREITTAWVEVGFRVRGFIDGRCSTGGCAAPAGPVRGPMEAAGRKPVDGPTGRTEGAGAVGEGGAGGGIGAAEGAAAAGAGGAATAGEGTFSGACAEMAGAASAGGDAAAGEAQRCEGRLGGPGRLGLTRLGHRLGGGGRQGEGSRLLAHGRRGSALLHRATSALASNSGPGA